jgi:hypothetical protein
VYVRARTLVTPALETKHLHEPGEDAERSRASGTIPWYHELCRLLARWQIEMTLQWS